MNILQTLAGQTNRVVAPLLRTPVVGGLLRRSMTELTYTGRRSGRTYRLIVAYRRRGPDEIVVGVAMADRKSWWRNFYPEPGPILVHLDGLARPGTAVATRTAAGTGVRIQMEPIGITDAAENRDAIG